jgi:hypothetical protein
MCQGKGQRFVFRKLRDHGEVLAQLKLRCRAYAATPHLSCFVGPECLEAGVEVDEFDRYSDFYGVFDASSSGDVMVGSLRVTGRSTTPFSAHLEEALRDFPDLRARSTRAPSSGLPSLGWLPGNQVLSGEVRRWISQGRQVFEGGRLALDPSFQNGDRLRAAKVARHLARCACALPLAEPYEVCFVSCLESHSAFYLRHGFHPISGLSEVDVPRMGIRYTAHCLVADAYSPPALRALEPIAQAYRRDGEVSAHEPA